MKIKDLYIIIGFFGILSGLVSLVSFIASKDDFTTSVVAIGCIMSIVGVVTSGALISLANLIDKNDKQQKQIDLLIKYIKTKEDSSEIINEIEKINENHNK